MRVLALENEKTNEYTAFIANDVIYDEEIDGIGFFAGDSYYYIPNVSIRDCNYVCQKLVIEGFCDVTSFGEIECDN